MTDMMMIMIKHSRLVGKDGDSENEHLMMMSFDKSRSSYNSFIVLFRKMILFQFPSSLGGWASGAFKILITLHRKFFKRTLTAPNFSQFIQSTQLATNQWHSKFNLWTRIQSWTQAVLFVYGSTFYNHYNLQISQNKAITIITWTLPSCHSATFDTFPSAADD